MHPSRRLHRHAARGEQWSDFFIGRLATGSSACRAPCDRPIAALLAQNGADFFTPGIRAGLPSSIDELRRDNPLLSTLARLPTRPGVPCHSIIGRKDPAMPLAQSTDGIVPYDSSHLSWTASERVVPGDHGCQDTPETIAEIRRILYLHLKQTDREVGAPVDSAIRFASRPRAR